MSVLLFTLVFGAPQPKMPPAPAPRAPVNKAQPRNHRPYLAPTTRADPRYYTQHGKRFKHGYYYTGYQHPHWSYHYWDRRYATWLYYDPGVKVYYWWCPQHYRYYPVSYLPEGCRYDYDYEEEPRKPAKEPPAPPPYDGKGEKDGGEGGGEKRDREE